MPLAFSHQTHWKVGARGPNYHTLLPSLPQDSRGFLPCVPNSFWLHVKSSIAEISTSPCSLVTSLVASQALWSTKQNNLCLTEKLIETGNILGSKGCISRVCIGIHVKSEYVKSKSKGQFNPGAEWHPDMFTKSVGLVMMCVDFTGLLGTQKVLEPNKVQKVLTNDHSETNSRALSPPKARKALFPPLKKVELKCAWNAGKYEEIKLHLQPVSLAFLGFGTHCFYI